MHCVTVMLAVATPMDTLGFRCKLDTLRTLFCLQVATYREQKKLADKQRKLQEKAHRVKEESLRDDDNVFDVAFENQGAEAAEQTVSATDIKVFRPALALVIHRQSCFTPA